MTTTPKNDTTQATGARVAQVTCECGSEYKFAEPVTITSITIPAEMLMPQATKPVDEILEGLVDWAESGRTTLGRPNAITLTEAATQLKALLTEARIDEVKRMNEIANRSQMQTASKFKMYDYMADRLAQLKNEGAISE